MCTCPSRLTPKIALPSKITIQVRLFLNDSRQLSRDDTQSFVTGARKPRYRQIGPYVGITYFLLLNT